LKGVPEERRKKTRKFAFRGSIGISKGEVRQPFGGGGVKTNEYLGRGLPIRKTDSRGPPGEAAKRV